MNYLNMKKKKGVIKKMSSYETEKLERIAKALERIAAMLEEIFNEVEED